MEINGNCDFTPLEAECSMVKPAALGFIPTAVVGVLKSSLSFMGKVAGVAGLALSSFALCARDIPHQHPKQFLHPVTNHPLKPGDIAELPNPSTGKIEKKLVVGYSGHHQKVFLAHATLKDQNGNVLVARMDQRTLWTGPFHLVASGYVGENKKIALVVANPANLWELSRHDVSSNGRFESLDGAQAIAISSTGQNNYNVELYHPSELGQENIPGLIGKLARIFKSLKKDRNSFFDPSLKVLHNKLSNPVTMQPF